MWSWGPVFCTCSGCEETDLFQVSGFDPHWVDKTFSRKATWAPRMVPAMPGGSRVARGAGGAKRRCWLGSRGHMGMAGTSLLGRSWFSGVLSALTTPRATHLRRAKETTNLFPVFLSHEVCAACPTPTSFPLALALDWPGHRCRLRRRCPPELPWAPGDCGHLWSRALFWHSPSVFLNSQKSLGTLLLGFSRPKCQAEGGVGCQLSAWKYICNSEGRNVH